MKRIAFCDRCRGIEVGWNRRYLIHSILCLRLGPGWMNPWVYLLAVASLISLFPTHTGVLPTDPATPILETEQAYAWVGPAPTAGPSTAAVRSLLERYSTTDEILRERIARAVVSSGQRYNVDPQLVTSVLVVESAANPYAISDRHAVGLMQIHLETWGGVADAEGINLFNIEHNVEMGTRILSGYVHQHGLWNGVTRYRGLGGPLEESERYLKKIQSIYFDRLPAD